MAINSYASLKTQIAAYLDRNDLTSQIPNFIALAESDMQADIADLAWLQERATATTAANTATVNTTGIYSLVDAYLDGEHISMVQPSSIPTIVTDRGKPSLVCVDGVNALRFYPTPDAAYVVDVIYVPVISPSLAGGAPDDAATNWILQQHPGVYMYGALLHASAFIKDDGRLQLWQTGYETAINRLRAANRQGRTTMRADTMRSLTTFGRREGWR
jgi:hypothetical protein